MNLLFTRKWLKVVCLVWTGVSVLVIALAYTRDLNISQLYNKMLRADNGILKNAALQSKNKTTLKLKEWSNVTNTFPVNFFWKKQPVYSLTQEQVALSKMIPEQSSLANELCPRLFKKDNLLERFSEIDRNSEHIMPDSHYKVQNCSAFVSQRKYLRQPVNQEEGDFPLAFSILMYKDVEQVERLLRAIYRPQNYYCIHIDRKAKNSTYEAMSKIASCFDNVFLASDRISVVWAKFSVLEPEIVCMQNLLKKPKWKYFINLTGQEFPLKTNYDLVKILKVYNGATDVGGYMDSIMWKRTAKKKKKIPPPEGIVIAKGPVHITVPRAFVNFMFENEASKEFLHWVNGTTIPDETYFNSLAHSPGMGVPGAHTDGLGRNNLEHPSFNRYKRWKWFPAREPCRGYWQHGICMMSIGNLYESVSRPELFLNKIILKTNRLAYECLEFLHYQRTKMEILGTLVFNTTFYENIEFVHKHI